MRTPRARSAAPRSRLVVRLAGLALASGLAAGLLTGCTGDDDDQQASPADRLAAAKQSLDQAKSVELDLSTDELPKGVDGVLSAKGTGTHAPAFKGTIEIVASGFTGAAEVVAVDDELHAKLPFTDTFVPIDPASYGAPDPEQLMSTDGGISSLLTSAQDVSEQGQSRDGDLVLTDIAGTIPGADVQRLFPTADDSGSFDAVFTLTDSDELNHAELSGPFYAGADDVTYTIRLETSDQTVEITPP